MDKINKIPLMDFEEIKAVYKFRNKVDSPKEVVPDNSNVSSPPRKLSLSYTK